MKEMEFNFEEKDTQKFEDFFKALHKHYTDSKKFECGEIGEFQNEFFTFQIKLKNDKYSSPMGVVFNLGKSKFDKFISLRFYIEWNGGDEVYICNNTDTIKNMAIISNTFMKAAKVISVSDYNDYSFLIKTFENSSITEINEMFE